jgi:dipeptide/tripeptide permease
MEGKTATVLGGFFLCLIGTIALLQANLEAAAFCLGLGLIVVGVASGFVKELLDMFSRILESIFRI